MSRGIARPGRAAATPLSRHQQAMILPHVERLAAEGLTDGAISAWLAEHGPFPATLSQVCRLRRRNGIKSLNDRGGDRKPAVILAEGVKERYVGRVQSMAAEGSPDREIAEALGLSKSQISVLRWTYGIKPGLGQRRTPLATVAEMPKPSERRRRIKDPLGAIAICNYCTQPVSAYFNDTAEPHNRILPERLAGGIVQIGPCKGAGRVVRWVEDEWAVPLAA